MMKRWIVSLCCILSVVLTAWAFSGCKDQSATVHLAAKDFTEQYILGEMLKAIALEYTDLRIELTSGVAGETSIILPAMVKGDFDAYAEYDSTAWMTVLKRPRMADVEAMHEELEKAFQTEYNLTWLGYYGFDNTYGIAVRKETAEAYGLVTYSDLAKVSDQLIFGAGYEFFEREDGYTGLQKLYHPHFKEVLEMNLSLKYNALLNKQVDAITIYKTDGRMKNPEILELKDDKDYFPPALCGTVIRSDTMAKYPELADAFKKLNGMISLEEMRAMNAAVDMEGRDPKKVALEFLRQKDLIKDE